MDIGLLFLYSVLSITSAVIYFILGVWRRKYCRLPPGPPGWPIVGNLLQLGNKPNESLFHLSTKYGPLMCLSLGMQTTVVASSPAMAKEILKTHDHLLAGRTVVQSLKSISHEKSSIVFAQCGSHWRMLRRISNTELFSVKRLEALQHLRRDQVNRTIREIFEDAVKGKCVDIGHTVFHSAVNLLGNMAFGKGVFDLHSQAAEEFKDIVSKLMELNGIPNIADFFPFLQFLDPQGISRDVKFYMGKKYDIIDKFIDGRLATRGKSSDINDDGEKDLLDVLLDMRSDEFTVTDIRGYLTDIFGAGSDTTTTTIEWAMAELIRNPEIMKPFGAGRRMCVGLPLASRMVHLVLGSLLHSFEWAPPDGMNPEQVDMTDKFGLTLKKAVPLYAIPTPRLPCDMYY